MSARHLVHALGLWPRSAALMVAACGGGPQDAASDGHALDVSAATPAAAAKVAHEAHRGAPAHPDFSHVPSARAFPLSAWLLVRDMVCFEATREGSGASVDACLQVGQNEVADAAETDARLANLGAQKRPEGGLLRVAGMEDTAPMALFQSPDLPHVDAIAIVVSPRASRGEPPILPTLSGLFAALADLPDLAQSAQVNVFLADDDAGSIGPAELAGHLTAAQAARVHIWGADANTRAYAQEKLTPVQRTNWNYGRALRSYAGSRGLLVLQDDVVWADDAARTLAALAGEEAVPALSLGDGSPSAAGGAASAQPSADVSPHAPPHHIALKMNVQETREQTTPSWLALPGVRYAPNITAGLGRYMQLRAHVAAPEGLVGDFLHAHALIPGTVVPSLLEQRISSHPQGPASP